MIKKLLGRQQGFTLLELLIVIVIIGILATIVVPGLTSGPRRARDTQRKADLRGLKNALEVYYNDNNSYPTQTAAATDFLSSDTLVTALVSNYAPSIPCDPRSSGASGSPKTTTDGTAGNDTADCAVQDSVLQYLYQSGASGASYTICATTENATDPDDGSTATNSTERLTVNSVNGTAPTFPCST